MRARCRMNTFARCIECGRARTGYDLPVWLEPFDVLEGFME